MNSDQFIYWLNGYLELANPKELNEQQIQIIKDHINLVLKKVTPSIFIPRGSDVVISDSGDLVIDSGGSVRGSFVHRDDKGDYKECGKFDTSVGGVIC